MLDLSIVLWCVVLLVEGNDRSLFLDSLTASITEGATVAAKRSELILFAGYIICTRMIYNYYV